MKQLRPYQVQAVNECWDALKKNDEPVLLMASVGAGKSLMLANILLTLQKAGKRALCLVNNAELVRNNCETLIEEGGNASIYCAALSSKDASAPIVFGTPQSILNGITKNETIGKIPFNIIVVDEAHAINFTNHRSCFMRILRHYKTEYPGMRLLGATGTNFRFKGSAIVGDDCLFKTQTGNITTERLIAEGYLIEPHFEINKDLVLDFSQVRIKKNGQFDQQELEEVIDRSARLTELICKQVVHVMETQNRFGVFLFATTKKHAYEILSHLPVAESAIILGETPQEERTRILDAARKGHIKYLVNIAIISVGVDIPAYDTLAYMRPTESLVLLVQTMGRVLRLAPWANKTQALVMDFAGNIERHQDWDNPTLVKAIGQTIDKDKPLVIVCPACQQLNTEAARRCIGVTNEKRCEYFFEFKDCVNPMCDVQNDLTARHCRACATELIDPNAKLNMDSIITQTKECDVVRATYSVQDITNGVRLSAQYECLDGTGDKLCVSESYFSSSDRAKRVFYGQFVKKHCPEPGKWFTGLVSRKRMDLMIQNLKTPERLVLKLAKDGFVIKRKIFNE